MKQESDDPGYKTTHKSNFRGDDTGSNPVEDADLERAELVYRCEQTRLRVFEIVHKPPFRTTRVDPGKLRALA